MQGKYQFKLLAVDVPAASGAEQRLYLEGDDKVYHRGGVINELRDPFIQVCPQYMNPSQHFHLLNLPLPYTELKAVHSGLRDFERVATAGYVAE